MSIISQGTIGICLLYAGVTSPKDDFNDMGFAGFILANLVGHKSSQTLPEKKMILLLPEDLIKWDET